MSFNSAVRKIGFVSTMPNGRALRYGGIAIEFSFYYKSRLAVEKELKYILEPLGLIKDEHYRVPAWNYNNTYAHSRQDVIVRSPMIIMFTSHDHFIASKLNLYDDIGEYNYNNYNNVDVL